MSSNGGGVGVWQEIDDGRRTEMAGSMRTSWWSGLLKSKRDKERDSGKKAAPTESSTGNEDWR